MRKVFLISLMVMSINSFSQRINVTQGSLAVLKDQPTINVEFTYNNMSVGRFSKEEDYIESRKKELNFKAPGTGDKWAIAWVDDRKSQFEPKFLELFNKESNCIGGSKPEAKYTMIIHTSFSEPGYNLGPFPGGRKNASINADVTIVETADRSRSICTITIDGAPGRGGLGYDFDTGFRIQECYAVCGKRLSTMINKIKK